MYKIEFFFKIFGSFSVGLYILYRIFLQVQFVRSHPQVLHFWGWLNWSLVLSTFFLFFLSYLLRRPPLVRARGVREIFLPLLCAVLPFGVYESVRWWNHPAFPFPDLFFLMKPWGSFLRGDAIMVSTFLILVGNLLTVWGLFYLKEAFSILTQARLHVQEGPYQWIRHPLYVGESLATMGFFLIAPSWFNLISTFLFLVLQRYRAGVEEQKLSSAFSSYVDYRKRTGAYFPRIREILWPRS